MKPFNDGYFSGMTAHIEFDSRRNPFEDFRESGSEACKRISLWLDGENNVSTLAEVLMWRSYDFDEIIDDDRPLDGFTDWNKKPGKYDIYDVRYDIWGCYPMMRIFFPMEEVEDEFGVYQCTDLQAEVLRDWDKMGVHTDGTWDQEELYDRYSQKEY